MKTIYVINVRSTGYSGNVINSTDSAYTNSKKAHEVCCEMNDENKDDPNFMAYVTGPILLYK